MSIDWQNFTPWESLTGGVLIGLAVALFILMNGRIAGISGIIGGLARPVRGDITWRVLFIIGLVTAPWVYQLIRPLPEMHTEANTYAVIAAGLLVGLGTRYGSGCTSGHGVCGLSRLSLRGFVATLAFMIAGFFTVYEIRQLIGGV